MRSEVLKGHVDLLLLSTLEAGPLHGYGVLLRIAQISGDALQIPQGSLYPALYRLERDGLIQAEWGESDNNRKAKYYTITPGGRRRLKDDAASWDRLVAAIAAAMSATPNEI